MDQPKKKVWTRRIIELMIFAAIIIAFTSYQLKDMLAVDEQAAPLVLPSLPAETGQPLYVTAINWQTSDKTLVYFFAPWCSVCRVSMPSLSMFADHDNQVIAVASIDELRQAVQQAAENCAPGKWIRG